MKVCSVKGCDKPFYCKLMCQSHYRKAHIAQHGPYLRNKNKRQEAAKRYRNKHPELVAARNKAWREANREKLATSKREYAEKNRDKLLAYWRQYRLERRDNRSQYYQTRRARINAVEHEDFTEAQVIGLYGTICHLCGLTINMSAARAIGIVGWENGLHIDHVIPISKGGGDTLVNVRPAHGLCNLRKQNKL